MKYLLQLIKRLWSKPTKLEVDSSEIKKLEELTK